MAASTALVPLKEMDPEQIALIKRTVAAGATTDELALFLFDCQRRGVHPLDKLLHFTKRNGKYTPITSIDFLRTRAHATEQCAGISDAEFTGEPKQTGFSARVVVKRVVAGHIAEFSATARWDEYKPQQNDFMWARMPHTMLGKCAEALALRKAFPQELAGLYTGDEMAQAGKVETVTETVNTETGEIVEQPPALPPPPPEPDPSYTGLVTVKPTRKRGPTLIFDFGVDEQTMSTVDPEIAAKVRDYEGKRATVTYSTKAKGGLLIVGIAPEQVTSDVTADDIPF